MVKVQFTYFEVLDDDFTGIIVKIIDKDGEIDSTYSNFNANHYTESNKEVWENQTEEFEVCTVDMAKQIIRSNAGYMEVKFVA